MEMFIKCFECSNILHIDHMEESDKYPDKHICSECKIKEEEEIEQEENLIGIIYDLDTYLNNTTNNLYELAHISNDGYDLELLDRSNKEVMVKAFFSILSNLNPDWIKFTDLDHINKEEAIGQINNIKNILL